MLEEFYSGLSTELSRANEPAAAMKWGVFKQKQAQNKVMY